jgi:hypothetical protein
MHASKNGIVVSNGLYDCVALNHAFILQHKTIEKGRWEGEIDSPHLISLVVSVIMVSHTNVTMLKTEGVGGGGVADTFNASGAWNALSVTPAVSLLSLSHTHTHLTPHPLPRWHNTDLIFMASEGKNGLWKSNISDFLLLSRSRVLWLVFTAGGVQLCLLWRA